MESSHTTAASAQTHDYHDYIEYKDHISICLVGPFVVEPWILRISGKSDVIAVVLSWCFAKWSQLTDRIEAEYTYDNDCGKIDALCQGEQAAA